MPHDAKRPSLLIAGCGYVGTALGHYLSRQGWTVWGLLRTQAQEPVLRAVGITPIIADLTKSETLTDLPQCEAVVAMQAPSRQKPDYKATYLDGTQHLVEALTSKPPQTFMWISSTSVYGASGGEWVSETSTENPPTQNANILLQAESVALNAPFTSMVLRLGGIYGPSRDRIGMLRQGVVPVTDTGYVNHIHIDDIVRLIPFLIEYGSNKEIYLGVDNAPVKRSEFYKWLASEAQIELPKHNNLPEKRAATNKRCSNQKIKSLGFKFEVPTYKQGYQRILKNESLRRS